MKKILLMMTLLLTACMREGLRDGDLIFQANDPGDFTGAIENVTGGNWSHVGILEVTGDGVHVLEATTTRGVTRTSLEAFLDGSAHDGDGRPLVRVYRLVDPASGDPGLTEQEAREAVRRAHGYIGRPYDFAFDQGMDAVYCSELVYECFLRADGSRIFPARPMTFKRPDGQTDPYWEQYYEKMGKPVPEGAPGTNPNDMSREPFLQEIPVVFPAKGNR